MKIEDVTARDVADDDDLAVLDQFAAAALAGIMSAAGSYGDIGPAEIADMAYDHAEAMMFERERRPTRALN